MLRHRADIRTLLYLAAMIGIFAALWTHGFDVYGRINWPVVGTLLPVLCVLAVADAVISHNHNHVPIFKNRWANLVVGYVITFFYGFPSFGWIPTHNMNHHALNNKPGDYSITTRPRRKIDALAALIYPTVVSLTQTRLLGPFLKRCRKHNRFLYWRAISEYIVFYGVMIALFVIDWQKALLFALIPQQVALFTIQSFNYVQHIDTDSYSEHNHSRNFTGRLLNLVLFNNGYHTVHHLFPGTHWSQTPALHREYEEHIDPALNEPNAFTFVIRRLFLDPLRGRHPAQPTLPAELTPDTLHETEAGKNALRAAYAERGLTLPKALEPEPEKVEV